MKPWQAAHEGAVEHDRPLTAAHCPMCGTEVTVGRRHVPSATDPHNYKTVIWCPACERVLAPDELDVRGSLCVTAAWE